MNFCVTVILGLQRSLALDYKAKITLKTVVQDSRSIMRLAQTQTTLCLK